MAVQSGRATVTVGVTTLQSKPGASLSVGGLLSVNGQMSDQGQYSFQNQWVMGEIKATLIHTSDVDLDALRNDRDVTVLFETDTGTRFQIPTASPKEIGELSNGEVEITWEGPPAQKV